MKSEEAIAKLREMYRSVSMCLTAKECREHNDALDTAINALEENKALRKLLDWAVECNYGIDCIDPDGAYIEQLDKFWEENDKATYIDGLIYLAKLIIEDEEK